MSKKKSSSRYAAGKLLDQRLARGVKRLDREAKYQTARKLVAELIRQAKRAGIWPKKAPKRKGKRK